MKKLVVLLIILLSLGIVYAQTAAIEITDYESSILVEKGWVRYLSIDVENSGDVYLNNVGISVEGDRSSWFEIQTNRTDLSPNQSASFLIKLYIPLSEEKGKYYFSLIAEADETSVTEEFTVELFTSRSEMLLEQIQNFRESIDELKQEADDAGIRGKDVEDVKLLLLEAAPLLEAASNDVYNKMYEDATEKIRNAEILLTKAEYDLSIAATIPITQALSVPLEWILIIALIIIIILMFLWFFVFKKHVRMRRRVIPGKIPGLKIKRLIKQEKERGRIDDDIRSLEDAASLLEEEYREGLISKQSYDEMKSKYEEKILNLKNKK